MRRNMKTTQRSFSLAQAIAAIVFFAGCTSKQPPDFLGSAVIESRTYQIAGMTQGMVLDVYKREGAAVKAQELLATIDTVQLVLKLSEIDSRYAELEQTLAAKRAEKAALEAEIRGLAREYGRIGELADKGSVPTKQKDDLGTRVQASNQKLKAAKHVIRSLEEKKNTLEANRALVKDQLSKCYLRATSNGVVISRYKNPGEIVGPGMPVLEIATFDTVSADFFVPQPVLANLKYGQNVRIRVDTESDDGGRDGLFVPAIITWISDEAEFSPKNIQTRESRNELVFKVRAEAANPDGILKRGLPVEVWK
ncbi:MAG: HlyD family efflux transporter periplasmic adaptor subunit [Chitinivibrionales bacterium]|nr:HlyD family efflux transporter periplasmic adaptor subunit [Chitinivibrionales bacterium]MBD3396558.1 HlyD family efflux transporter periplasmic adaptor subunit [Chitinivibrionales bacterium]